MESYNNLTGFSGYSIPSSPFSTGGSTTSSGSKFDWSGSINTAINLGSTIYANETQRKLAQKQADALIAQGVSQERVQQLILEGKRLDLETAKAGGGTKAGSPVLYIALGVGAVIILGVVIFAVTRKKA